MSSLSLGDVIVLTLPSNMPPGHEQEGHRRAIVVGLPARLGTLRHPMVMVVPFTSAKPHYGWAHRNPDAYPFFPAGRAGLTMDSVALIDQLRSVDVTRIGRRIGALTEDEFFPVAQGLARAMAR